MTISTSKLLVILFATAAAPLTASVHAQGNQGSSDPSQSQSQSQSQAQSQAQAQSSSNSNSNIANAGNGGTGGNAGNTTVTTKFTNPIMVAPAYGVNLPSAVGLHVCTDFEASSDGGFSIGLALEGGSGGLSVNLGGETFAKPIKWCLDDMNQAQIEVANAQAHGQVGAATAYGNGQVDSTLAGAGNCEQRTAILVSRYPNILAAYGSVQAAINVMCASRPVLVARQQSRVVHRRVAQQQRKACVPTEASCLKYFPH